MVIISLSKVKILKKIYFKMIEEINFKILCDLTTNIVGLRKGSLSCKNREKKYQIPRSVAAVVARMIDKTHRTTIAKELKRDRSLVYHYEKVHKTKYKAILGNKYREVFNQVYNAYSNLQGAKRTFVDNRQLEIYLRECGIISDDKYNVIIRITSGRSKVDIKVSYKDFYHQLELCKFALTDCNYNLEII